MKAALNNGANAVYIGLDCYSLRSHSKKLFTERSAPRVENCHSHDAKLYLSTNRLMNDLHINSLEKILPDIASVGVDALIASDLGLVNLSRHLELDV